MTTVSVSVSGKKLKRIKRMLRVRSDTNSLMIRRRRRRKRGMFE